MYEQLKLRIAGLLGGPLPMRPQTERQLSQHLSDSMPDLPTLLRQGARELEDYELDILFGPLFTPTLEHRAEVAEFLLNGPCSAAELERLVRELCTEVPQSTVLLPDGTQAGLALHEVMIERFVRLLRLEAAPDAATARLLRQALPDGLWPIGLALVCEHGMTPRHQQWFVRFAVHLAERHPVSSELLRTVVEFIAAQPMFDADDLLRPAEDLMRATERTHSFAAGGHAYWSADVAQHHHYRGQGRIDRNRVEQRQAELEHVGTLVEALRTFPRGADQGAG